MQIKLFRAMSVFSLVLLVGLFLAMPARAQELPAGVDATTEDSGDIEQLPAGVDAPVDQPTDEGTITANTSSSQQDFLTGLAAGAAAGFIVGGIVVWYVKRN